MPCCAPPWQTPPRTPSSLWLVMNVCTCISLTDGDPALPSMDTSCWPIGTVATCFYSSRIQNHPTSKGVPHYLSMLGCVASTSIHLIQQSRWICYILNLWAGQTCLQNLESFAQWEGRQNGTQSCPVVSFEYTLEGRTKAFITKSLTTFCHEGFVYDILNFNGESEVSRNVGLD